MTFAQSLRSCFVDKLLDFSGRAPRSEYWWFTLFQIIVVGVIPTLIYVSIPETFTTLDGLDTPAFHSFELVLDIVFYLITVPYITVSVRRFHDLDLSGWWFIGMFVFSLPVEFDDENMTYVYLSMLAGIVPTLMCIRKGTDGPNRFGPDPLKPDDSIFE